ncbi:MAG: hypothetical protein K2X62_08235 [Beijerinckiaceae bacterium]|nr:hypothetical protein [Beijerinckiaceae bacterium]
MGDFAAAARKRQGVVPPQRQGKARQAMIVSSEITCLFHVKVFLPKQDPGKIAAWMPVNARHPGVNGALYRSIIVERRDFIACARFAILAGPRGSWFGANVLLPGSGKIPRLEKSARQLLLLPLA